jgi:hypothetical protein
MFSNIHTATKKLTSGSRSSFFLFLPTLTISLCFQPSFNCAPKKRCQRCDEDEMMTYGGQR